MCFGNYENYWNEKNLMNHYVSALNGKIQRHFQDFKLEVNVDKKKKKKVSNSVSFVTAYDFMSSNDTIWLSPIIFICTNGVFSCGAAQEIP